MRLQAFYLWIINNLKDYFNYKKQTIYDNSRFIKRNYRRHFF